jgi:hypothetical protein
VEVAMLIPNLILAIETHAETLAAEFVADLMSNPKVYRLRKMGKEDLERAALGLYGRLSAWLAVKDPKEIEDLFTSRARVQRQAEIPLREIVFAVLLLKRHVWEFVKRNALVDSISDLYARDEVIILIAEFFDRMLYATVCGYEEGGSEQWTEPKLFA